MRALLGWRVAVAVDSIVAQSTADQLQMEPHLRDVGLEELGDVWLASSSASTMYSKTVPLLEAPGQDQLLRLVQIGLIEENLRVVTAHAVGDWAAVASADPL